MAVVEMYGADWCKDCVRSKRLLDEHQVEYAYTTSKPQPELAERVIQYNIQAGLVPSAGSR